MVLSHDVLCRVCALCSVGGSMNDAESYNEYAL